MLDSMGKGVDRARVKWLSLEVSGCGSSTYIK